MAEIEAKLLAPDEPPAVRVLQPAGRSDLLFVADHAGRAIPRRLGTLGLPQSELARHIAWDIGIAAVTERLSAALDATAVLQSYSRLVIGCNRQPHLETSIPVLSETTAIPGNLGLSQAERDLRRREIFVSYQDMIAALLDRRQRADRRTVMIAMHSFTPVFKGVSRPITTGVLYNRDRRLAAIMLDLLRRECDLVIGDNQPYVMSDINDYTMPVHAEGRELPYAEIEIRQDLIADTAGQAAWAERLARLLPEADRRLRELAPRSVG